MTVGYLCAIGVALIFMLYMDGQIGVMMLAFLIVMPVLSVLLTWIVKRYVTVTLMLPDTAAKYQPVTAVIKLEKSTPIPLPFLRMQLTADAHFEPLNPNAEKLPEQPVEEAGLGGALRYRSEYNHWKKLRRTQLTPDTLPLCLSMGAAQSASYQIRLIPHYCGSGNVTLTEIQLSDYLAMVKFRMKIKCENTLLITPEIPELKANSTLFRSVSTAVAAADEESEATPNHSASAMPGYEHRDYIPGDSLKRINWKLSSKRHRLMVRQDEPIALARLSVVLDFRRDTRKLEIEERLAAEEQLIETALGFLMLCAKYGYPCKLCYADANASWSTLSIDEGEQLAVEAITLLRGGFREQDALAGLEPLPPGLLQDTGTVLLCFTTHCGAETAAVLEQYPDLMYLITPEQFAGDCTVPQNGSLWLVTPDRRLVQTGGEI